MAEKSLSVKILTSEARLYEGQASAVFVPGALCPFEILPMHAPLISLLERGTVRLREIGGGEKEFTLAGGIVEVRDNTVTICAEAE